MDEILIDAILCRYISITEVYLHFFFLFIHSVLGGVFVFGVKIGVEVG